jgi:SAM-dependent methyltransferase
MSCPLCGAPAPPVPAFVKDGWPIARCGCGMAFVARPVDPATLDRLYGAEYYTGGFDAAVPGYHDYAGEEPVMRRNFGRRLALIERFTRPGPLLDVGCALGFFVGAARDRGWEARGVELSGYAVAEAAGRGLPVEQGDFLTMGIAPGSLAAVTMLDMLEHVADPRPYVRRARSVLRPGGVIAIETGDLDSRYARLAGRRYHFFQPPNHLSYFSRRTLGRLLREEGFAEVAFFSVGKWVTVRRLLYHLYVRAPGRPLRALGALAERLRLAGMALPVKLGDDLLALGRIAA